MMCSVAVVLCLLLLVASNRSPILLSTSDPTPAAAPRQGVVIFIADISDYFDAHSTYVQSVMQQKGAACTVRPPPLTVRQLG